MTEPILKVSGLSVELNQNKILSDVSFEVKEKETLVIIGPNGAGKTMLFRSLLGLIPYQGKVLWRPGVKISYIPQRLFVERDLPITTQEFLKLKESSDREIDRALTAVGFVKDRPHTGHLRNHILNRKIGFLSGGEFQKVLIAWALLGHPNVLLFDEPTAGVDNSSEVTVYSLLNKLKKRENLTVLLISHELDVVYHYATSVLCLNKERVCYGLPQTVLNNESLTKLFGPSVGLYQHH